MKIKEIKNNAKNELCVVIEKSFLWIKNKKTVKFTGNIEVLKNRTLWFMYFCDFNGKVLSFDENEQITNYLRINHENIIKKIELKIATRYGIS